MLVFGNISVWSETGHDLFNLSPGGNSENRCFTRPQLPGEEGAAAFRQRKEKLTDADTAPKQRNARAQSKHWTILTQIQTLWKESDLFRTEKWAKVPPGGGAEDVFRNIIIEVVTEREGSLNATPERILMLHNFLRWLGCFKLHLLKKSPLTLCNYALLYHWLTI